MNKLLLSTLLVCLTLVHVSSGKGPLDRLLRKKKPVPEIVTASRAVPSIDFYALDRYLTENLEAINESDKNLAFVRENIDSLSGPTRKAADLLLEVSQLGKECNEHAISVLRQVSESNLKEFGGKRIDMIIRQVGLEGLIDACSFHANKLYQELTGDDAFGNMFYNSPQIYLQEGGKPILTEFRREIFIGALKNASKGDPKAQFLYTKWNEQTRKSKTIRDEHKFHYALNTYLLEPCRQFISNRRLNLLLEETRAILALVAPPEKGNIYFYQKVMRQKVENCRQYLNLDAVAKAKLFPTRR